jgi:triacylglycerol lipase
MSLIPSGRISQDVAAALQAFGPHFSPDILKATWQLFAPFAEDAPVHCEVEADIAYGADARQTLDLFKPDRQNAPILIYVPGGGFVGGSKDGYGRLGRFFADAGYLTIIPDYRLAPAHAWPAGAMDIASVVDWAVAAGGTYGADTDRIYVFGQSAGATHVASATLDLKLRAKAHDRVRAVALMSGIYSIGSSNLAPNIVQYFGSDPGSYWRRAPLAHASNASPPMLLLSAEFDPFGLGASTLDLAKAMYMRDGINPPSVWMGGHNHISGVACIGTSMDDVSSVILEFFDKE